jgi:bile acid:Na+ symporter, BASS family
VLASIVVERDNLVTLIQQVGLAALTFNLASMTIGYAVPRPA